MRGSLGTNFNISKRGVDMGKKNFIAENKIILYYVDVKYFGFNSL